MSGWQEFSDWIGCITGSYLFQAVAVSPRKLSMMYGVSWHCLNDKRGNGLQIAKLVVSVIGFALWVLVPLILSLVFFGGWKQGRDYYPHQCFGAHGAGEFSKVLVREPTPTEGYDATSGSIKCYGQSLSGYTSFVQAAGVDVIQNQVALDAYLATESNGPAYCYSELSDAKYTNWGNRTINGYDNHYANPGLGVDATGAANSPDYHATGKNVVYRLFETIESRKSAITEGGAMFLVIISAIAAGAYFIDGFLVCIISNPKVYAKEKSDDDAAHGMIVRHRFGRFVTLLFFGYIVAFNLLAGCFFYTLVRGDIQTQFHHIVYNGQIRDPVLQFGIDDSYTKACGCIADDFSYSSAHPAYDCINADDAFELHPGCWVAPKTCPHVGGVTMDTFLECDKATADTPSKYPWAAQDSKNCPSKRVLYEKRRDNFYHLNVDDSNTDNYHVDGSTGADTQYEAYVGSPTFRKPYRQFFLRHLRQTLTYFTTMWSTVPYNVHPVWAVGIFMVNLLSLSSAILMFVLIVLAASTSNQNIISQASASLKSGMSSMGGRRGNNSV